MGNTDSKLIFRKAIVQLTSKNQVIEAKDETFWEQFWSDHSTSIHDVFSLIPPNEIRLLRDNNPANLATLCYKATERLTKAVDNSCRTQTEQQAVLNCVRVLTRILPYIFESSEWKDFFWNSLPTISEHDDNSPPLAHSLLNAISDLLFCPDFTVSPVRKAGPDKAEDLCNIDSCEYIWETGVGFAHSPPKSAQLEQRRTEFLKLLLTCFSETIYRNPNKTDEPNKWIAYFTSAENRHALPLFTSFLNTVCAYDPVGLGVPYNHLIFSDTTEPLVEVCLQILIVTLDHDMIQHSTTPTYDEGLGDNLFINYLSRIHRDEDFQFILKGITRLLNNPLVQSYLPNSTKRLHCHQELLVFFWKICDYNKKFLYFVLKSSDVLDVLVPILYHLNDSRADQSRVGLMHIGVFILLLLSGERNFGVRLNKPYTATVPMDIPVFTGTHADLLITVFHKIIATGHQRLQPLFDCLLTILVNVSPYLKTLSMVASVKLLHLLEAFSTPWFLFSSPSNHHLVFFLLEIFNNIIQYQFDGNSNLVYTIIRKRHLFHALANLPSDMPGIAKCLSARKHGRFKSAKVISKPEPKEDIVAEEENEESNNEEETKTDIVEESMEGSTPAKEAEPGTLQASLLDTPGITQMTEKESANPENEKVDELTEFAESKDSDKSLSPKISLSPKNSPEKEEQVEKLKRSVQQRGSIRVSSSSNNIGKTWTPTAEWVSSWKSKLPLQTIMRLLQVLVPQVEKICIDKGLTDESEILKFLQHGTLVGLLPVPHPILIRKYQANTGTTAWFRTYMWGVIYLRNVDPAIWYETEVKLFEIQRV
ncbi:protein HID1 [Condylostylus longicornis]|uniref:protein HID1 n=1 Tax=Condylostylus longicornis TaxID=2530218 RepID=UPI00244DB84B|nr:protein HID1 [Condylostylus longicornis]